jgi:uncharacterized protein
MWQQSAKYVIKNRRFLLILMLALTGVMGYFASKVKLSYEFSKAIPTDNQKYQDYLAFKEKFGDDGNLLVIGIQTDELFRLDHFKEYQQLEGALKKIKGVEDIISIPGAINLVKDSTDKITAVRIFPDSISSQHQLDSFYQVFANLPFYKSLLYNPNSHAYLMGAHIRKDILKSKERTVVVNNITSAVNEFGSATGFETHLSGLPLIRTVVADRIQKEMKYFLLGSLLISILILILFFRSLSTTLLSLMVVLVGVVWTIALIYLCGYEITLLTALLPSLVVVIGIPNCIYFINRYHSTYLKTNNKHQSLIDMVSKMGVVTLFCNITAAIGFVVFAFTRSAILKEFGVVAGSSIMVVFFISFILLPSVLSYMKPPKSAELRYLNNKLITNFLARVEFWVYDHKRSVIIITVIIVAFSVIGIGKLKTVGYIVDDLPKTDKIYTDLKFFEHHFKGIMPLEIVIDTKKPNGLRRPGVFERIDTLSGFIASLPETNRPMSLSESFKFFYQAFSEGDSNAYVFPNEKIVEELMRKLKPGSDSSGNSLTKTLLAFVDSGRQRTRLSVSMEDMGTEKLPVVLNTIKEKTDKIFDSSHYKVILTGTSITFLEGSRYIINGLKESILWAFILIAACMLYLFRSFKILLCSLIPNIIPLVVTAGIMGWAGVPLKPSTVLVFSVALGIAVDITIRFLVNYKQELAGFNNDIKETTMSTIRNTGLSIIYTSLVLTAGFIIFCISSFGGTFALGWLTSVTLFSATLTNIILLPTLILMTINKKRVK